MSNDGKFRVYAGIPEEAADANRLTLLQQFVENDIEDEDLLEEEKSIIKEFKTFSREQIEAEFLRLIPLVSGKEPPADYKIKIW